MSKLLNIEINVSVYGSIDALKDSRVIDNIVDKVRDIFEKKRQVSNGSIIKASKNAILFFGLKKNKFHQLS
jgi:hypothetical protein